MQKNTDTRGVAHHFWTYVAFFLATIGIIADSVFKVYALENLPLAESMRTPEIATLALFKNPGVAFGIPVPYPILFVLTLFILFSLFALVVRQWNKHPAYSNAALVVIMGALGNFIDRFLNGFTTDYIFIWTGAVINLADVIIICGVIWMIFAHWRVPKRS